MRIFQATSLHIDQIVELFDAYRVWYRMPTDKATAKAFLLERIYAKESVIFVCENEKEQLVGFTQLYPIFSSTRMKRMWLLNDLFVQPEYRGKGILKQFIEKA